jgi:D-alanyl-D-alanine-carboxypeptidase/D-alanyl-D-alanine-endopeptidase
MIMSAPVVPPPALFEDAIRRLLVERVDERRLSVGVVVGVTEANGHRFVAHGCRDTCGGGPVNEKTLFEIGSITKLFTALLLSDMANQGEVRLDEPVAELLPAGTRVPARDGKAITLRDLGACPNSRCSILSESDSTLGDEQVFSPLESRSDAASAAECG